MSKCGHGSRWARRGGGWDEAAEFRGWGRGHRGHHHGGGMRRMFDQGDLRLVVLALIAEQPRHGYDIIKEIEARVGGGYAPSPGVIYPLLTMLEELGLVSMSATEGSKKLYAITPEGEAELAANKQSVEALFARIDAVRDRFADARPAEILRAFENLKFALRLRMERGGLDPAKAQTIAAALDAAAQAVERA
ncbi:MAG: PadR family transcriptional regulator [Hyphomonadaceae bacterium]|nr:PadR family transcriptional regulator [Hyphomonadaceae bacterium]